MGHGKSWSVVVETKNGWNECIDMGDAKHGKLDGWLTVRVAGEHAMSKSPNGSCSVALCKGPELVSELFPKGRDNMRRNWEMQDVVEKLKLEVKALESLEAATS